MKSYKQYCGVAKALDLIGERWTLLLVRDLLLGPRRYTDLLRGNPGITTNLLAKRLDHLQHHGLVERQVLAPPSGAAVYALTPRGLQLEPVVLALGRFGEAQLASAPQTDRRDLRYAVLSARRRFQGSPGRHTVVLQSEDGPCFTLHLSPEGLRSRDGDSDAADARIHGVPGALARLVVGRAGLSELPLRIEGDADAAGALEAGLHRTG